MSNASTGRGDEEDDSRLPLLVLERVRRVKCFLLSIDSRSRFVSSLIDWSIQSAKRRVKCFLLSIDCRLRVVSSLHEWSSHSAKSCCCWKTSVQHGTDLSLYIACIALRLILELLALALLPEQNPSIFSFLVQNLCRNLKL